MADLLKTICLCVFSIAILFAGAVHCQEDEHARIRVEEQLQSFMNSSMAYIAKEVELKNQQAVADPEEIVMTVHEHIHGLGAGAAYARATSLAAKSSPWIGSLTSAAGALQCRPGYQC